METGIVYDNELTNADDELPNKNRMENSVDLPKPRRQPLRRPKAQKPSDPRQKPVPMDQVEAQTENRHYDLLYQDGTLEYWELQIRKGEHPQVFDSNIDFYNVRQ